jgi:NAD(P)H-flavin reductase/hemoglobin-like flavoprotein
VSSVNDRLLRMTIGLGGFPGGARAGRPARHPREWPSGPADEPDGPGCAAAGEGGQYRAPAGAGTFPDSTQEPPETWPGRPVPSDARLLRKSLALLEPQSEKVMAHFFATLFVLNPELRPMFPLTLGESRKRVFQALTRAVWSFDQPEPLTRWLGELGRDHRKFGVTEQHYRLFCDALLATVQAFCAGSWSDQVQAAWERALAAITAAMMAGGSGAPGEGTTGEPAWWLAEVVEHDLRRPDLAVLALRPDQPLPYLAGQHISVQVPRWPRMWREYSIANAPAPDGLLRLHVRAVPGGGVSAALVHQTRTGDTVVAGRARGEMTANALGSGRVVCVTGGTGLAPGKAIAEALTGPGRPHPHPAVWLFFGARIAADLYDLPDLQRLARARPSLTVIPVVSAEPGYRGLTGTVAQVAAAHLPPGTGDIVISGPAAMVARAGPLVTAAAPAARLHLDPLPGGPRPL